MPENARDKLFMEFDKQLGEARARQKRIRSLDGMIRKGNPKQAEQAKKALMRLQREAEEEKERKEGR